VADLRTGNAGVAARATVRADLAALHASGEQDLAGRLLTGSDETEGDHKTNDAFHPSPIGRPSRGTKVVGVESKPVQGGLVSYGLRLGAGRPRPRSGFPGDGGGARCPSALVRAAYGCRNITPASPTPQKQKPRIICDDRGLLPVRGGGTEPPGVSTASTSNGDRARDDVISRGYERQETAANAEFRLHTAKTIRRGDAVITEALREVIDGWERGRDRSRGDSLRRHPL
jgi:hypothetical protein